MENPIETYLISNHLGQSWPRIQRKYGTSANAQVLPSMSMKSDLDSF
jgi:hypothetical protein